MTKKVKTLVLVAIFTATLTLGVSPAQACACDMPNWSTMSDDQIVATINRAEDELRILAGQSGELPPPPAGYQYDDTYRLVPL